MTKKYDEMPPTVRYPHIHVYAAYSDWPDESPTQNQEYIPETPTELPPPPREELPTLDMGEEETELPEIDPKDVVEVMQ